MSTFTISNRTVFEVSTANGREVTSSHPFLFFYFRLENVFSKCPLFRVPNLLLRLLFDGDVGDLLYHTKFLGSKIAFAVKDRSAVLPHPNLAFIGFQKVNFVFSHGGE